MENNQEKRTNVLVSCALLLALICIISGVSYAFFTYIGEGSTENTITTGTLTFVYDEQVGEGNGISLKNALPISDEQGKILAGSNQTFDFQVLAAIEGENVSYEVIAEKQVGSNLPENLAKIYLTTLDGMEESPVSTTLRDGVVTTYDQLTDTAVELQEGKTIYQESISSGEKSYKKQFRLRMWVSEDATGETEGEWNYNNQSFSVKVNVVAKGQ